MCSISSSSESFHAQLAAVIEVLANTAVAEICKLVDDGYAVLRLEITQNQREIDGLRRKLLVAKFHTSRRNNQHLDRLSAGRRSSSSNTQVRAGLSTRVKGAAHIFQPGVSVLDEVPVTEM